jgi:hypothetical protein
MFDLIQILWVFHFSPLNKCLSPHEKIVLTSTNISSLLLGKQWQDKPNVLSCFIFPLAFYFYLGVGRATNEIKTILLTLFGCDTNIFVVISIYHVFYNIVPLRTFIHFVLSWVFDSLNEINIISCYSSKWKKTKK